jgi:general secretion pathway protein G
MSATRTPLSGFTLLEVLAVIAIIAVVTGLVVGAGRRVSASGKSARARAELVALSAALETYRVAHGDYPRTGDPTDLLQALIGKRRPDQQPVTTRPLIETLRFVTSDGADPFVNASAVLLDPWGQPYSYAYKSQTPWLNPRYVLGSAGPDAAMHAALSVGGFPDRAAGENGDNIYAD